MKKMLLVSLISLSLASNITGNHIYAQEYNDFSEEQTAMVVPDDVVRRMWIEKASYYATSFPNFQFPHQVYYETVSFHGYLQLVEYTNGVGFYSGWIYPKSGSIPMQSREKNPDDASILKKEGD